jgi:uncharacterized low-complexity protein
VIRRMQLLGPEDRPPTRSLAAVGERIRDGLLRDNRVVPAVLATLVLLVFAWLVTGAFIGGSPDEEAANQASLAQDKEEPDSGEAETPAPGVENRDIDSYSAFKSKDPFHNPLNPLLKAGEGKAGNGKAGDSKTGDSKTGGGKAGANGSARDGGARDGGDSAAQPSPGDLNSGGTGQGGSGDLFSSGGELPAP